MKILHVIPSFSPTDGGPIHALMGLMREQLRQGHEVEVMTTNISGTGTLDGPTGNLIDTAEVKVWYFAVEYPRWWCFSRPLSRALRKRVRDFDLVHIHSIFLWPTTISAYWCRRYGVPYIIRPAGSLDPVSLSKLYAGWRESLISRMKKWLYLRTLAKWDLGRANAIHFTSQDELDSARPFNFKAASFVIPLGVEEHALARDKTKAPEGPKSKKVILFLSRLDPIKGLDKLIPAVGQLAQRRDDFTLFLAGKGPSDYEARLRSSMEGKGLEKRVNFTGFVYGESKRDLLSRADIFVLPSYHENFGIAVVEAMAAGLPVVISNRVNIWREIGRAEAGIVVEPEVDEIARALERLLADDDLREEMGRKAAILVQQRFIWPKVGEDVSRMYEQVVKESNPTGACPLCADPRIRVARYGLLSCGGCGLLFDPLALKSGVSDQLEREWFEEDKRASWWVDLFEAWNNLWVARRILRWKRGGKLMEVGVGSGSFLAKMRDLGFDVRGCDLSGAAAESVSRRYGMPVDRAALEDLPEGRKYDVVVMNHVLEHVNSPKSLLGEAAARLRDDGVLHVAVPNVASWEAGLPGWASYEPYHLLYFTPATLRKALEEAGFEVSFLRTNESFSGWFLALVRTALGAGLVRDSQWRRRSRGARARTSMEHLYRLAMVSVGVATLPLRILQARLKRGDEIIALARPRKIACPISR